jgi:putative GTP pyrophosphokinase
MSEKPSASQLNKLGERLRKGTATDDDIRALNDYRESFRPAYERVVTALESLGLDVGGRSAKTVGSIVAKLAREKTRLSTMQDIAGCRVEVSNRLEQDRIVGEITNLFSGCKVDDRRAKPSHGYRAVHVIVVVDGCPVEIQVRTTLQNAWAQTTERLADRIDPAIKYGGGSDEVLARLTMASETVQEIEQDEIKVAGFQKMDFDENAKILLGAIEHILADRKNLLNEILEKLILSITGEAGD